LGSQVKTESELLFERYLTARKIRWTYEEPVEGATRRPDYRCVFDGEPARFEIKQFESDPANLPQGFGQFDPYPPVREKLKQAASQLKALKGKEACCVVLWNAGKPLVFLGPLAIYAAMLGDITFVFPFDPGCGMGDADQGHSTFGARGRMSRYDKAGRPIEPQATTISAVVVLSLLDIGVRRLEAAMTREEKELGRDLNASERWDRIQAAQGTNRDIGFKELRVVVHENPYAAKPLAASFGSGPYDERYGVDADGRLTRIFCGPSLRALEQEETAAGVKVNTFSFE
jgi:hypothetical protein